MIDGDKDIDCDTCENTDFPSESTHIYLLNLGKGIVQKFGHDEVRNLSIEFEKMIHYRRVFSL